mmetsp:Transcript_379/g.1340  ORF Transcript_379/g.1340 Transcript_379/m.1340 type:complete len:221 (-) Transcript_379:88-750(-)
MHPEGRRSTGPGHVPLGLLRCSHRPPPGPVEAPRRRRAPGADPAADRTVAERTAVSNGRPARGDAPGRRRQGPARGAERRFEWGQRTCGPSEARERQRFVRRRRPLSAWETAAGHGPGLRRARSRDAAELRRAAAAAVRRRRGHVQSRVGEPVGPVCAGGRASASRAAELAIAAVQRAAPNAADAAADAADAAADAAAMGRRRHATAAPKSAAAKPVLSL